MVEDVSLCELLIEVSDAALLLFVFSGTVTASLLQRLAGKVALSRDTGAFEPLPIGRREFAPSLRGSVRHQLPAFAGNLDGPPGAVEPPVALVELGSRPEPTVALVELSPWPELPEPPEPARPEPTVALVELSPQPEPGDSSCPPRPNCAMLVVVM